MPGVVNLGFGFVHLHLEIAAVLELSPDALGVFFELGRVVRLGKDVLEEDRVGDANRLQVLHGRAQGAVVDVFVALEADAADLDLGTFADHKCDAHGGRRDGANFGANGGFRPRGRLCAP